MNENKLTEISNSSETVNTTTVITKAETEEILSDPEDAQPEPELAETSEDAQPEPSELAETSEGEKAVLRIRFKPKPKVFRLKL